MKKKLVFISMFVSILSSANIKEYRPNYELLDKYKLAKKIAGVMQEYNYVSPFYSKTNHSELVGVKIGDISYSYNNKLKDYELTISKNISEFLDTTTLKKYYQKLNEFYILKDKKKNDYKEIIAAYFEYILANIELNNSKNIYDNAKKSTTVYEKAYALGNISEIELEKMKLKLKYIELEYMKNEINLKNRVKMLDVLNIDKSSIEEDDINIYEVEEKDIRKYVDYENEKIDVNNNINYYENLKNRIDSFMPDIYLTYSKNKKDSEFSINVSKTIPLIDSKYIDNAVSENRKVFSKIKYQDELKIYKLHKNILDISKNEYELAKKELEISKVELELGKISELKYIEKLEEVSNKEIEMIKNKISLSKYILERE
ncbi:hypothetical protein [Oceanivirga miroungae]|uniref:Outer membrane efflux protein n=1 Tax=Oceanivirga miroungae TaxID=1130046 RepID=A0A6I8MD85_9FUSO|nr:hypothetical protein [Oceanivirga miroungae]VWL85463.1 hypothetical protein OMES3154_00748 [Oceanivirga miroungae]